jgi:VanZ family protein
MKFILITLLLAIVTELIQLWIPKRTFNIYDWVANVSGVIVGVRMIKMVQRHDGIKARRNDRE